MQTLGELGILIGAEVNEAGFTRAVNAIGGIETAAQEAAAGSTAALNQIGAAADKSAQRIMDAGGRVRDGYGKFVTAAQLAADAANNVGGSIGTLGDVAGRASASLNGGLVASFATFDKTIKPLEAGIGRLGEAAKSAGQSLTIGLTLPIGLAAAGALTAFGNIDSLQRGINAISTQDLAKQGVTGFGVMEQAAAATKERVAELEEIAKAPGIGFEQAIKGDIRLRAVGISARDSAKDLKEFANAVATSGGSASDFDRVTVQLAQLSAKGKVLSQDLRPIIEAAPAVAEALQKLYGTIDSEDISKQLEKQGKSSSDFINVLTDELAKLPRVTGGFANQLENFQQGVVQDAARLGDSLNKAFNLEGLLDKASAFIDGLTDSFTSLDPTTQKVIFGFVGVVAAIGPVLVGVGTLGAALPAVIAGFGALSGAASAIGVGIAALAGPIGLAVAALAGLAAGIYYVATASDRSLSAYQDQAKQTDSLTASIAPLLARYNELSAKTTLSAAEQTELAAVIKQLAAIVPGATTAIDAYGNATGISAAAVADFTKALQEQKAASAALNLPAATQKLDELGTKYKVLKAQADEFNKTGTLRVESFDAGGGSVEFYKAGSQAVNELQANLATANIEFLKQKQVVDDLKGSTQGLVEADASLVDTLNSVGLGAESSAGLLETLRERLKAVKEQREKETTVGAVRADNSLIDSLEKQIKDLEGGSKKGKDALAELQKALRDNGRESIALGADYDYLGKQQKVIETGITNLIKNGYDPAGVTVQRYVSRLRELNILLGDNAQLSGRVAQGLEKALVTPDFKLDVPALDKAPDVLLPDYKAIFSNAAKGISEGTGGIEQVFGTFTQAQADFNTNMGQLLDEFPAEAFARIGEGIGEAIGSGGDVLAAAGKELLKALAGFLSEYGRFVILKGVADIALGNVGQGIAEVVAGGALVALGGIASGIGSSIGQNGAGASLGSQPGTPNSNPATQKQQPLEIVIDMKLRGEDLVAVGRLADYRSLRTR